MIADLVAVGNGLLPTCQAFFYMLGVNEKSDPHTLLFNRTSPRSTWLVRASSKLRLTAARFPFGRWKDFDPSSTRGLGSLCPANAAPIQTAQYTPTPITLRNPVMLIFPQ